MDILYLIDRLENLVDNSTRMPLVNQIMLKESDILSIIEQMRSSIPHEIKQARRIVQEKERILAQAQSDASHVLSRAREETERALTREGLLQTAEERSKEILRRANEQAQTIIQQAEQQTDQLQNEADAYVAETLRNLREHLVSVSTEVERTVISIEKGLESLEGQVDEAQEQDPPRRASLAADTIGGPPYPP